MDWVALIPALPVIAFAMLLPLSSAVRNRLLWLPVTAMVASLGLSIAAVASVWPGHEMGEPVWELSWRLATVGGTPIDVGLALDSLAAITLVTVTIVATCVLVYSLAYMRKDPRRGWYFAVVSLFTAAMLALVLSSDLLLTFAMWELMGLCSYLLIGFWYELEAPRKASQKAFLTTRVGDLGFLIALFAIYLNTGQFGLGQRHRDRARVGPRRRARRLARPAVGGDGQVGADPAARVAARRDGGPNAGLGAHPRGDDGCGGRVRRRPHPPHLQDRSCDDDGDAGDRRCHRSSRRTARGGAARHQEGGGVLDDQPARPDVRRAGGGQRQRRALPPHDARVLQVAHLPRRRRDHPRSAYAGHARDGRAREAPAGDHRGVHDRVSGACGRATALRLLQQGRDPRVAACTSTTTRRSLRSCLPRRSRRST